MIASLRAITPALLRRLELVACVVGLCFVVACGGSSKPAARGPSFLVTSEKGLSERTGSHERPIITYNDGSYVLFPALSDDGKMIAFVRQPPAGTTPDGKVDYGSDLYVANRDGSGQKRIVQHAAVGQFIDSPVWMPSGHEIIYDVRGIGGSGSTELTIESVNLDTGANKRLLEDSVEPSLTPDGKTLAYVHIDPATSSEHIELYDIATAQSRTILGDSGLIFLISLAWSPDGKTLAFGAAGSLTSDAAGRHSFGRLAAPALHPFLQDIYLIDADGSNIRRVADIAESQPSIAWSPDGATLYVMGASAFSSIDIASGERKQLGEGIPQGQIVLTKSSRARRL